MTEAVLFLHDELPSRPEELFRSLATRYVDELEKVGVRARVSRTADLAYFRSAAKKVQLAAISYLEFNLAVLSEMNAAGEDPRDNRRLLWRAFQKMKVTPPASVMDFISDEDVVEIYLTSEIQVFRNIRFMEIVSHTLEDLLCRPWYKLGRRGWRPMLAMFRVALKFKLGLITEPIPWNVEEHLVEETDSVGRVQFLIALRYFIPLKKNGKVVATVSTNRSQIITSNPSGA